MKNSDSVTVSLQERSYKILIQDGGLAKLGECLRSIGLSGKAAIVTNPRIRRLYGSMVIQSLKKAGYQVHTILLPDGEQAKTLAWSSTILQELMVHRFERGSVMIALGGGVIGDITGFAASIYLRGIPFVQVATTLVAQVDSSVGGKTGVNHRLGKNLIGTFYQPRLVLADTNTLRTLPKREWVAGLAEVVKYGMIADRKLFAYLENRMDTILRMDAGAIHHIVKRCCEIKASVVAKDEQESGLRRILNYGHTVGHALESLGKYRKLIHGEAVAIGMVQEAALSRWLGYCSADIVDRQRELVRHAGLPDTLPPVTFAQLWAAMQHDKKVVQGQIHCILPRGIGRVEAIPLEQSAVKRWFQARV